MQHALYVCNASKMVIMKAIDMLLSNLPVAVVIVVILRLGAKRVFVSFILVSLKIFKLMKKLCRASRGLLMGSCICTSIK